ncbi:MAG: hypothetical protein JRN15_21525 [Nitrososphaerota archaeon]|nr:hypothetical protein [Nitrososphaerota archaeon]
MNRYTIVTIAILTTGILLVAFSIYSSLNANVGPTQTIYPKSPAFGITISRVLANKSGSFTFYVPKNVSVIQAQYYSNNTSGEISFTDPLGHVELNLALQANRNAIGTAAVVSDPPYVTIANGVWHVRYLFSNAGPVHLLISIGNSQSA